MEMLFKYVKLKRVRWGHSNTKIINTIGRNHILHSFIILLYYSMIIKIYIPLSGHWTYTKINIKLKKN